MATVGFIGLGHMGAPMASNLLAAGHDLRVFDIMTASVEKLAAEGAQPMDSAAHIFSESVDVLITMLPSSPHVESLYVTETALLDVIPSSTLVIECSTIAPDMAKKVAAAAKEKSIALIDAPVSGGTAGAVAGTLTFMVGGEAAALEQAQTYLSVMGKNVFHAGDNGAGQVAKICNNMLLAIHMIGTAETLQLGINDGLDPKVLSEIMKQSSGNNWSLQLYNPVPGVMDNVPAANEYDGGFMVDLMAKDLGLALEAALSTQSATPMGSLARSLYKTHSIAGNGKLDFSSIYKMFGDS